MKKILKTLLQLAMFAGPLPAFAQTMPSPPSMNPAYFVGILCSIAGWMFTFLIVFSIIAVLLAAFSYLTAMGDPEKIGVANRRLIFAALAVAVSLFARGLPTLVAGLLGASIPTQC